LVANVKTKLLQELDQTDSDGDGIPDISDECPFAPENFNGNRDLDGCPDSDPEDIGDQTTTMVTTTPTTFSECTSLGFTWIDTTSVDYCFKKGIITNGVLCKTYDALTSTCSNPKPTGTTLVENADQFGDDLIKGKILTLITFNYDDFTKVSITSDNLQVSTLGNIQLGSLTGSPTSSGSKKALDSIDFEVYYTRDTLAEVSSISLAKADIEVIPIVRVAGTSVTVGIEKTTGITGTVGKAFAGNHFGISLGKITVTQKEIEDQLFVGRTSGGAFENPVVLVPEGQTRDIVLQIAVQGNADFNKLGITKNIIITGHELTLDNLTVANKNQVGDLNCEALGLIEGVNSAGDKVCKTGSQLTNICVSDQRPNGFPCDDDYINAFCERVGGAVAPQCIDPDTDGDGVFDFEDRCDNVVGTRDNDGCPVDTGGTCADTNVCTPTPEAMDSDGDGIIDERDRCPTVAGLPSNNGCPVPVEGDADGDGVPDNVDQCPTIAGSATNRGCPIGQTGGGLPTIFGTATSGIICSVNSQGVTVCPSGNPLEDPNTQLLIAVSIFALAIVVVIIKRRS